MSDTLLLGTTKGAFVLRAGGSGWAVWGPHCGGWTIHHVIGQGGAIWAAGGGAWFGAGVWRSVDGGATWTLAKLAEGQIDAWCRNDAGAAAFLNWQDTGPAPFTGRLEAIWSLARAGDRLLAGGKPAALYASDDGGASWRELAALAQHPSRHSWNPGAAGLVLHTILADPAAPQRLWVGISAAGVFASEDGGASWERRNRIDNDPHGHDHRHDHPAAGDGHETGHCVHSLARADGDRMWQQNHHGVYRSADGGRSWRDVSAGLPSRFGFPVAVDPEDPDTAWVIPLNGDTQGRFPPGAAAAVWKTTDGGATWVRHGAGLPQSGCFFTVLRQAMAVAPGGLAFGTNTGSVFVSRDGGESWQEIARHLPTVLSVEFAA
jgi:photosystem II stability/assembly factor-like uncharacterized protein